MTVIHNAANKRTQITTADGGLTTYAYDDIYQLTEEHRTGPSPYRHTYAYDSVQNRTVKVIDGVRTTSTFDAANQLQVELTGADRTTYTFDNNGNEILKQEPSSDRTTTTYDFENQANAIVLPTNVRNTMSYNPDQLRVKLEDSSGTTKYVWDGASYLFELDGTNTTKAVFTQEPGSYGGLNSQYRYNGSLWLPSYYHSDSLGNTTALTDDTEDITDTYQYDAFGNVLSHTGSTVNPFQFGGSWGYCTDPDTGHVYIRARIYIPRQGRWTSVDVLLFVDGPNVYAAYFVPNGVDPSGRESLAEGVGWPFPGASSEFANALNPPPLRRKKKLTIIAPANASCCPRLERAVDRVNSVVNGGGDCERWFDSAPHEPTGSVYIVLTSSSPLFLFSEAPSYTSPKIPFTNRRIFFNPSACNKPITELSSLLVHELAHQYCNTFSGRETCAVAAQRWCEDEL